MKKIIIEQIKTLLILFNIFSATVVIIDLLPTVELVKTSELKECQINLVGK